MILARKINLMSVLVSLVWPMFRSRYYPQYALIVTIISLSACAPTSPNPIFSDYNYDLSTVEADHDVDALNGMSGGMVW